MNVAWWVVSFSLKFFLSPGKHSLQLLQPRSPECSWQDWREHLLVETHVALRNSKLTSLYSHGVVAVVFGMIKMVVVWWTIQVSFFLVPCPWQAPFSASKLIQWIGIISKLDIKSTTGRGTCLKTTFFKSILWSDLQRLKKFSLPQGHFVSFCCIASVANAGGEEIWNTAQHGLMAQQVILVYCIVLGVPKRIQEISRVPYKLWTVPGNSDRCYLPARLRNPGAGHEQNVLHGIKAPWMTSPTMFAGLRERNGRKKEKRIQMNLLLLAQTTKEQLWIDYFPFSDPSLQLILYPKAKRRSSLSREHWWGHGRAIDEYTFIRSGKHPLRWERSIQFSIVVC